MLPRSRHPAVHAVLLVCRLFVWGLWWLFVLALGILTLGGFLAQWDYFWEVACHFRVQYCWLLAGATLFPLLFRRWKTALVPALLAAVNLTLIAPLYFGGSSSTTGGKRLRVLSLNVEAQNKNYPAVRQLVDSTKPDFVVLLDVTAKWQREMQPLLQTYPYATVIPSPGGSGVGFYSRIEPKHIETPNIGLRARPIVVASFEIDSQPVTIIAAHTRSPRDELSLKDRNYQFVELGQLVRGISGDVILIGDLNSSSWSPDFVEMIASGGLVDSRQGRGVQPTWPAHVPLLQIPIDHCLVTPQLKILERRVERDVGSDHLPILVDFSVR